MKGVYDHVSTRICKKGEQMYPGSWMLKDRVNWNDVYMEWSKILSYCKRHHIVVGRHEELKDVQ